MRNSKKIAYLEERINNIDLLRKQDKIAIEAFQKSVEYLRNGYEDLRKAYEDLNMRTKEGFAQRDEVILELHKQIDFIKKKQIDFIKRMDKHE